MSNTTTLESATTLNDDFEKLIRQFIGLIEQYEDFTKTQYQQEVVNSLNELIDLLSNQTIVLDADGEEKLLDMLSNSSGDLLNKTFKISDDDIKNTLKHIELEAEIGAFNTMVGVRYNEILFSKLSKPDELNKFELKNEKEQHDK